MQVDVRRATSADYPDLTRLLWQFAHHDDAPAEIDRAFESDFRNWIVEQLTSHVPYIAVTPDGHAVGMAWLAVVARVPRPGRMGRRSADLQSVYVVPESRNAGIGAALVAAVLATAEELGVEHVSVHSSARAVEVYRRAGFADTGRYLRWSPD